MAPGDPPGGQRRATARLKYKRSFENESNTGAAKGRDCGGKESLSSEGVKESKRVIRGTLPNLAGRNVDY